jgi:hypothetical protein
MTTTDLDDAKEEQRAIKLACERADKYRVCLEQMRDQLIRWAAESKRGGWSTHQVEPMRKWAMDISEVLVD